MTQLTSAGFDFAGCDPHVAAKAGLMTTMAVEGAPGPYDSLPASGTPLPGPIPQGAVVVMNASGNAELANNNPAGGNVVFPQMLFVAVDGDQDFDGCYVHVVTCIQGGFEFHTDQYVGGVGYTPGAALTCGDDTGMVDYSGMFRAAVKGEQIYGFVGARGLDTTNSVLYVIIPQGVCPAVP
jgi:hypothetical protein